MQIILFVNFHNKAEGEKTFPANVDFTMKTDNLVEVEKKINAIKENDRKQSDIDQYNEMVHLYNETAKELNKINNVSQKTHRHLLELWHRQVDNFFEKHS